MVREIVKLFEFGSCGLGILTRFISVTKKEKAQVFEDWKGKFNVA